jgi:hypothetical protein
MIQAGLVARMWRSELNTKFLSENLKGGGHFTDLDVGGRIILKLYYVKAWAGFN